MRPPNQLFCLLILLLIFVNGCLASRLLLTDTTNLSLHQKSSEAHGHDHPHKGAECNHSKGKENGCEKGNEGGTDDNLFASEDYIYTNSKP